MSANNKDIEDLCSKLTTNNKTYVLAVANALVFSQMDESVCDIGMCLPNYTQENEETKK